MPDLPARPDLEQIRHQAKDLFTPPVPVTRVPGAHASGVAPPDAVVGSAGGRSQYGFASWPKLKLEVDRARSSTTATSIGSGPCSPKTRPRRPLLEHWWITRSVRRHSGYLAMLRSTRREACGGTSPARARWRELFAAGALVDGEDGDPETPLITAASYGDAEVARCSSAPAPAWRRGRPRTRVASREARRCSTPRCSHDRRRRRARRRWCPGARHRGGRRGGDVDGWLDGAPPDTVSAPS